MKKVLVTAGNTRVSIDKVRGIDNIFKGRTGARIAAYFANQGCDVTLLTSHPKLVEEVPSGLKIHPYSSFDSLHEEMQRFVCEEVPDVIIHSAAVSDYKVAGVYLEKDAVVAGTRLLRDLEQQDQTRKIGSEHQRLWMELVPTIKIVDQIRQPWGFRGILVKFKLQVGMERDELIEIAVKSMRHSNANFIVANTLEGLSKNAFIISARDEMVTEVHRDTLPGELYELLEM